ncbi:tyrosine decarboxylase [Limosilactobacillus reuteri]|uniref:Tyrosine decarboxylase n=1 Tax=Limosilactobacillus reuteri TaxID=1598 RepID=A0A855XE53_LIMRT|nr:tyrosine decarboxylase [Limosilactobacillus reuteri]MCC4467107.1 tyrosine decarboxylase [Limosilactobacillus reuteri]MCC4473238.1 tyrosine decarboxylase [Limosilactobacillus reuteri]MCT3203493.1 tyrosine decarboxylase [Limosilactobacillus reuteri]MCT3211260.1 tyrosine decarboxylase [Limosilactobacillus reuteri]MDV8947664.1 tyrosine decarboxylase [Limosilactobacillus reuteri]
MTEKGHTGLNLDALFIGDKSENADIFKETMNKLINEHMGWRLNYMPQDKPLITENDKGSESFKKTSERMQSILDDLSVRLRSNSVPWHSPRYFGHMNSETLMPAILAYSYAMLWNGNNVAYESSPGTSQMEEEVGQDFAKLNGYKDGWGHISADGSLANMEGLWYARNMKSLPLAMKEIKPELVSGKSEWELLNMPAEEVLDILNSVAPEVASDIKAHSARAGHNMDKLGKWIVPQTKHYSWLKAADVTGVGLDNVISCPVDDHYRLDVSALEKIIRDLADKEIPVLGVVAVVGSTEEGQIDPVDKIVKLRDKLQKEGIYFYLHIDAAYGSYGRSLFLDEDNNFIPYDELKGIHQKYGVFQEDKEYISRYVYDVYKAFPEAQSITVDPHKMGYVPYAAGGITIRHKSMRDIIGYFPVYVYDKRSGAPATLTPYILEGSKAGATAAAVWTAHRVLPLNVSGYGKLIGRSIEAANRYYHFLKDLSFNINGTEVTVNPLTQPDFNMVDWTFNVKGNTDLAKMNELNLKFYQKASFVDGPVYNNDFLTSHTDFATDGYGNSPIPYVKSLGFSESEWEKVQSVGILRACILTPFLYDRDNFASYAEKIKKAMEEKLTAILG